MKSSSTSLVGSLTCLDEVQVMLSLRPRELTHIAQQLLQAGLGAQTGGQAAKSPTPSVASVWSHCVHLGAALKLTQHLGQLLGQGEAEGLGGSVSRNTSQPSLLPPWLELSHKHRFLTSMGGV